MCQSTTTSAETRFFIRCNKVNICQQTSRCLWSFPGPIKYWKCSDLKCAVNNAEPSFWVSRLADGHPGTPSLFVSACLFQIDELQVCRPMIDVSFSLSFQGIVSWISQIWMSMEDPATFYQAFNLFLSSPEAHIHPMAMKQRHLNTTCVQTAHTVEDKC